MTSRFYRGKGQEFCDNSIKDSEIKSVTIGGEGVKKCPKLRGVIYGLPQAQNVKKYLIIISI
jgi:hypothetical protein